MRESVYIETSILGHLTARPTNNLILAANIKITQDWQNDRRESFILYASELVEDEAAKGDQAIATARLNLLESLTFLELTEETLQLAELFINKSNLPPKASNDAIHIALATVYGLDYLLTQNCKHIANAQIQRKLSQICAEIGYDLPIICTPYELIESNLEM